MGETSVINTYAISSNSSRSITRERGRGGGVSRGCVILIIDGDGIVDIISK
jgi:hypothetical protein